ncbi:MAG: AMP-binding protein, partial [bacterium]|nr:AMP-binding protein [bacterium]
ILRYWRKKIPHQPQEISLPRIAEPAMQKEGRRDASLQLEIPEDITAALKKTSKNSHIGLFVLFLSGLNVTLFKYTQCNEPLVGTLMPKKEGTGANLLFCRSHVDDDTTVKEVIGRVKQDVRETFNTGAYPFEKVYEYLSGLKPEEPLDIFNVAFRFEGFQHSSYDALENFELLFILSETRERLYLTARYPTRLYSQGTIRRFCRNWINLYHDFSGKLTQTLAAPDILSPEERRLQLIDFNRSQLDYPCEKNVYSLFEEQVERTPGGIAVKGPGPAYLEATGERFADDPATREKWESLTYRELKQEAGKMACLLREKGAGPGSIVGVLAERSIHMITAIMGILNAGGAYLPMDVDYPEERIRYILKDSRADLLVAHHSAIQGIVFEKEIIFLDGNPAFTTGKIECPQQAAHMAYVIYTSGSTGKPKGVVIKNRSVVNLITGVTDVIPFNENDSILCLSTI